jgi:peptide-methionine (S)-S-oxide reductase
MTIIMKATFAAGCFWGVEELFSSIKGVTSTMAGYTGGNFPDPSYQDVCTGRTGHAEAIQLEFDPNVISYEDLLDIFWANHNPTTPNQQGPDVGSQYRSAVFFHDSDQENKARKAKQDLEESGKFSRKIVTEIVKATTFFKAEEYHQKYLQKDGLRACSSFN